MPGPDPLALWIEHAEPGRWSVNFEAYWWSGNSGNRKARAVAILQRLRAGTWSCRWCGGELPAYRRADAIYCCEGCRKGCARFRRSERSPLWQGTFVPADSGGRLEAKGEEMGEANFKLPCITVT